MVKKLNIWVIQTGETVPLNESDKALRAGTLVRLLNEKGHSITWWASAFDHFKKKWAFKNNDEIWINEGIKIIPLKGIGYSKNISLSRFIDHRLVSQKFKKMALQIKKPDILIISMPPHDIAYEAMRYARNNHIPAVVDIRDPWPDIFLENIPSIFQGVARVFLACDFNIVKYTMREADSLISVNEPFMKWGLGYAGRQRSKRDMVFYLGAENILNDNETAEQNMQKEDFVKKHKLKGKFVVSFIGTFANYHDPSIIVECAKKFINDSIVFVLAGGGELFEKIKKNASNMNNVCFPGWLDRQKIEALLSISDVGVCPTNKRVDLFPNKTFSYFSAGIPVISAFGGELERTIETEKIGFNFLPKDISGLEESIRKLYKDRNLLGEMSRRVLTVFNQKYDAHKIYAEYVSHIENIAKKNH